MEPSGVLQEARWSSFDTIMPYEDSEIMAQLLGTYYSPSEQDHQDPSFRPPLVSWFSDTAAADSYCCSLKINGNTSSNVHHWSQGDDERNAGGFFAPQFDYDACFLNESNTVSSINGSSSSMDYCMVGDQISPAIIPDDVADSSMNISEPVAPQDQMLPPKKKHYELKDDISSESSKNARVSSNVTKSVKNVSFKRVKSTRSFDEEDRDTTMNCLNSCSYSSEDDSKAMEGLNGRKRADKEQSTNPQSLYARKRRERINERLRILQNLVPNGTKVDISTMLEEAVHYVKFLQLQIKLLSSDELWMYAPIAYNGINVGLDLKISPQEQQ